MTIKGKKKTFRSSFEISIPDFWLGSHKQTKAFLPNTHLAVSRSFSGLSPGSCSGQPLPLPPCLPGPPGSTVPLDSLTSLATAIKIFHCLTTKRQCCLSQLLENSGRLFLILIGFLIGLFMGCAVAGDEKAQHAIICLPLVSGRS